MNDLVYNITLLNALSNKDSIGTTSCSDFEPLCYKVQ